MFKTFYNSLGIAALFFLMCSMSECFKEDTTPGPETTIRGVLKDARTGDPMVNAKLIVHKYQGSPFGPKWYRLIDSVITKSDGSYNLKFIPIGQGDYTLQIHNIPANYIYFGSNNNSIIIGKTDTLNFRFLKNITLKVNLKNTDTHKRQYFSLLADSCCIANYARNLDARYLIANTRDTSFNLFIPQLSTIRVTSNFHNGQQTYNFTDTLLFIKSFSIGKNDTTINVVNQ